MIALPMIAANILYRILQNPESILIKNPSPENVQHDGLMPAFTV